MIRFDAKDKQPTPVKRTVWQNRCQYRRKWLPSENKSTALPLNYPGRYINNFVLLTYFQIRIFKEKGRRNWH
jgi:hypothetical protein